MSKPRRIVAVDVESQDEPERDQPPEVRREGPGDRAGGEDEHLEVVDPLAAEHVGDAAEDQRAERGGDERRRPDERGVERGEMPLVLDERERDADDEQVVRVGEESHPQHEHDHLVEACDAGVVEVRDHTWRVRVGLLHDDALLTGAAQHCVARRLPPRG